MQERLQEKLRELETKISNQEGSNKVILQNEKMLAHLKSMDGHAMHNVLKCQQPLIDGTNPSTPSNLASTCASSPPSMYVNLDTPSHGPNVASNLPSTSIPSKKAKMKMDYLQT